MADKEFVDVRSDNPKVPEGEDIFVGQEPAGGPGTSFGTTKTDLLKSVQDQVTPNTAHRAIVTGNPHAVVHADLADKGTNTHADIDAALVPFDGAGTTGLVPDPTAETNLFLRDDGTFALPPISPVGGAPLSYDFDDGVTAIDPGTGRIAVNNADITLATALYISDATSLGNDATVIWGNTAAGQFLGIWDINSGRNVYYTIDTTPVDEGTWFSMGVTNIPGTVGPFANNEAVEVFTIADPANTLPENGVVGQVLTKQSSTSYDTAWETVSSMPRDIGVTPFSIGDFGIYTVSGMIPANAGSALSSTGTLFVALESIGAFGTGLFAYGGVVPVTGVASGSIYYLATTGGDITTVQPTGSGETVRQVGTGVGLDSLLLEPDNTVIELA